MTPRVPELCRYTSDAAAGERRARWMSLIPVGAPRARTLGPLTGAWGAAHAVPARAARENVRERATRAAWSPRVFVPVLGERVVISASRIDRRVDGDLVG